MGILCKYRIYVFSIFSLLCIWACQKKEVDDKVNHKMPPSAEFSVRSTFGGELGENIKFENYSTNYSGCIWDFGDSTQSTANYPTHVYKKVGEYKVSLWVYNNKFTDSAFKKIYIKEPMLADFSIYHDSSRAPARVKFVSNSKGAVQYEWDLGNGEKIYTEGGFVNYPRSGNYLVKLTVFDNQNRSKSVSKSLTILPPYLACTINKLELASWPWTKSDGSEWDQGNTWQERYPDIYFIIEDSLSNKLIQTEVLINKLPGKAFYNFVLDLNKSNWNRPLTVKMMDEDGSTDELMFQTTIKPELGQGYPTTFGIKQQNAEFYFHVQYK